MKSCRNTKIGRKFVRAIEDILHKFQGQKVNVTRPLVVAQVISALAVFSRNALYKSTFYLLTYLLTTCRGWQHIVAAAL